MPQEIKFGTDGWRSVIGDGFTFQNVKKVTQATCDVIRKHMKQRLILVGYDNRFFSTRFAELAAQVAQGNDFKVLLSQHAISSPVLSVAVKDQKAAMGIMMTASHNPPQFNGFKLKGPLGGSIDTSFTRIVEDRIGVNEAQSSQDPIKKADFLSSYFRFLRQFTKSNIVKTLKTPVLFDAMHGPAGEILEQFIGKQDKVDIIRKNPDPLFGGTNPEPIEKNMKTLIQSIKSGKYAAGFAVDGDGDRIGVVDEQGRYLPPHTVMPLILLHLLENRKLKGKVIQTVSMGYLPKRIAQQFKISFEEVPVGFKNIAAQMYREKVVFGGEESGGYGVGLWFPERDGILCTLLLLEYLSIKKKPLSVLVNELYERFGTSHFKRVDFPLHKTIDVPEWVNLITTHLGPTLADQNIKGTNITDGIKIVLEDDSWVLMRPSGTEPLVRTYSESPNPQTVEKLLAEAEKLVHLTPPPPPKPHKTKKSSKGKKEDKSKKQIYSKSLRRNSK